MFATKVFQVLAPYQKKIESKIEEIIPLLGPEGQLRKACEYALLNGGKRFRPALVYMVANALGNNCDVSNGALAVEFFHTASLIADDLPCMDDDDERRNRPAVHKVFGEATALLATYVLIAAGYENSAKNCREIERLNPASISTLHEICILVLENASRNTGLLGASGGQYYDLYPPDINSETLKEVIRLKTVSLFEISFVLGWLFGGGLPHQLELVRKAAYHFGMAFQMADDLGDMEQDKQNQRLVNLANVFGEQATRESLQKEVESFLSTLKLLNVELNEFELIARLLLY